MARSPIRRGWYRWLVVLLAAAVSAGAAVAVWSFIVVSQDADDLGRVSVGSSLAPLSDGGIGREPVNVLVMGFDSTSQLGSTDPLRARPIDAQRRAEMAIVMRLDPAARSVSLLSIPSETLVSRPGPARPQLPLGSVNAVGGPEAAILAVTASLGVPIHHYMQLEFADLAPLVDAVGGVPLYVDFPLRDLTTGFEETGPQCAVHDGATAVRYVRSQVMEGLRSPETGWELVEGLANRGQIDRQRDLFTSLVRRADPGVPRPFSTRELLAAAADVLTVDDTLSLGEVQDLLADTKRFQENGLYAFTLPVSWAEDGTADILDGIELIGILNIFRGSDPAWLDHATRPGMVGLRSLTCR